MSPFLYANAAALSGLVIWHGVFARLEPRDRWRWFRLLLPLLAGWFSFRVNGWYLSSLHPLLAPALEHVAGGRALVRFVIDVGLREEFIKLLFAAPFLLWWQPHPTRTSALHVAAMVGLGFATAENRWFFGGHAEPTLWVGRVFATTALHVAATALCGAALSQAWQNRPRGWGRFFATFLAVTVAHGVYDWAPGSAWSWLRAGGTSWLSQAVVIILMAWLLTLEREKLPERALAHTGALKWFLLCVMMQHALALGLTWARWHTWAAVWICARECAIFLPVILCTAVFLQAVLPRDAKTQVH